MTLWTVLSQLKSQRCQLGTITTNLHLTPESCSIPSNLNERDEGVNISDLRTVLGILGTNWHGEEKLQERTVTADDITSMFEEQEPSVVEAKEAFDVFDENGDGFIDARELRRLLSRLGFHQASSEANCTEMIRAYDQNGDGLVDFHEFMKLLGNSFA
ncbi:Probable calcium-binding protein CML45 [Linum grandiflorum]